jgi:hypothetical protein
LSADGYTARNLGLQSRDRAGHRLLLADTPSPPASVLTGGYWQLAGGTDHPTPCRSNDGRRCARRGRGLDRPPTRHDGRTTSTSTSGGQLDGAADRSHGYGSGVRTRVPPTEGDLVRAQRVYEAPSDSTEVKEAAQNDDPLSDRRSRCAAQRASEASAVCQVAQGRWSVEDSLLPPARWRAGVGQEHRLMRVREQPPHEHRQRVPRVASVRPRHRCQGRLRPAISDARCCHTGKLVGAGRARRLVEVEDQRRAVAGLRGLNHWQGKGS